MTKTASRVTLTKTEKHTPTERNDIAEVLTFSNGLRIKKRSNEGLYDKESDGFSTPRFSYHIYIPGRENAVEVVERKSDALWFVKNPPAFLNIGAR